MSDFSKLIKRNYLVSFKTIWHDLRAEKDSDEFHYSGSQMFHGMQGEGKTVSMYKYGMDIFRRHDKSVIVTNLNLAHLEPISINGLVGISHLELFEAGYWRSHYIKVQDFDEVMRALKTARNDKYGVVFMIDEIHTYFHSHDSKGIPMWVNQVFSQQRKQHLIILGTVQDWEDLVKIIRRQAKNLVLCHKVWYFIRQIVVDPRTMETEYGEQFFPIKRKGHFFLSREIRDGMDTFQVIDSGRSVMGGAEMVAGVQKKKDGTLANRRTSIIPKKVEVRS